MDEVDKNGPRKILEPGGITIAAGNEKLGGNGRNSALPGRPTPVKLWAKGLRARTAALDPQNQR